METVDTVGVIKCSIDTVWSTSIRFCANRTSHLLLHLEHRLLQRIRRLREHLRRVQRRPQREHLLRHHRRRILLRNERRLRTAIVKKTWSPFAKLIPTPFLGS
jgi:hypothetical protein